MAEETQYSANTGLVSLATANSNLDGTGTINTIITASANGTLVRSLWIKGGTKYGMVRLFIYDGSNTRLIAEFDVPATTPGATVPYYEKKINLDLKLKAGYSLKASTEQADGFNIIGEGLDWSYYGTSVRSDTTKYTANVGTVLISTANPNVDGTGNMGTVLTAAADPSQGCKINFITVKAIGNTTAGMVRLFIYDGVSKTKMFTEISVQAVTKSYAAESFSFTMYFKKGFFIKKGYSVKASTENAESFIVSADAFDYQYEV